MKTLSKKPRIFPGQSFTRLKFLTPFLGTEKPSWSRICHKTLFGVPSLNHIPQKH